ncbi:MAG TPA: VOC family protein [Candidatus Dormibacteraeota bacterium]|nr:VOC family protein [Candidatus Dormibacteraeota bacterium]
MAVLGDLVILCADPERAADFWAGALGYARRPGPQGSIRLRPIAPDPFAVGLRLAPADGLPPGPSAVELDLRTSGLEAEVARLVRLGAALADGLPTGPEGRVAMTDPEGHRFWVVAGD